MSQRKFKVFIVVINGKEEAEAMSYRDAEEIAAELCDEDTKDWYIYEHYITGSPHNYFLED